MSLFDHALKLHRSAPDAPLPCEGSQLPDAPSHRGRALREGPEGRRQEGVEAALVLDAYFARCSAHPSELADAFHDIRISFLRNKHIDAAAERADPEHVRRTGRWLVRHGTDRCAVTIGLGLLAAVGTRDDISLVRTIGLLSREFGPLAARALEGFPGGTEALIWLADRATGWGRTYAVEALCRLDDPMVRPWLLRRACDGDFLNGYFAGTVATVTGLHEVVDEFADDHEIVDHTGRLLRAMSDCGGRGTTLADYRHAAVVLEAHARHVGSLSPTLPRFFTVAVLARYLTTASPGPAGCTAARREAIRAAYVSLLDRDEWVQAARAGLAAQDTRMRWLADSPVPGLKLRAFHDRGPRPGD